MYYSDPELVELADSISAKSRRSDFENLLVSAKLYSLAEFDDHLGEFAPILVKRDFVLAVLRDLRERGKLAHFLELLDEDLDVVEGDETDQPEPTSPHEDESPKSPPAPTAPSAPRLGRILTRLRERQVDWRLIVALLALAVTVLGLLASAFIIFYGSNLCQQTSPPPWASSLLSELCPPKSTSSTIMATATALPTLVQSTPTPTAQVISVGVIRIPDYVYTGIVPKLVSMGFDAEWIDYTSDYDEFRVFDIVYLPAGWGYHAAVLHDRETSFESFLELGGGLFVERPNALDPFIAYFLPDVIGFAPEITDPLEYPSVVVNDHEIVRGLDPGDLPEVGNLIKDPGADYQILTTSTRSNYPTLLIWDAARGRVVITASTLADVQDIRHPLSEELVRRALLWLVGQSPEG